jgi:putative transposase
VSEPTYYSWKKKYEGMMSSDLRRLQGIKDENRKLKKLIADSLLDNDALKALLEKYGSAR